MVNRATLSAGPWIPTIATAIAKRLECAESLLEEGQYRDAERLLEKTCQILEEDDPVNPSFIKAHVRSRQALAKAHCGDTDALGTILGLRAYLKKWTNPDGMYWFSVCFTVGEVRHLLGNEEVARLDFEKLWHQLQDSKQKSSRQVQALIRKTAAKLSDLGDPAPSLVLEQSEQQNREPSAAKPVTPKSSKQALDFVFRPRFKQRLSMEPVPYNGGTYTAGDGSSAWFNPKSPDDLRVLMGQPRTVIETDDPKVLASLGRSDELPEDTVVIYQPWREPLPGSDARLLGAMVSEMSRPIGESLSESSIKHLFLITGGVFSGALGALKDSLNGHQLETLGIVWHFTGDDITDVPTMVEEIAELCEACGTQKLSLLTGAFDTGTEKKMVESFKHVPTLMECSVFENDRRGRYPRYRTPKLDPFLQSRRAL
jgi:hypothetical protein